MFGIELAVLLMVAGIALIRGLTHISASCVFSNSRAKSKGSDGSDVGDEVKSLSAFSSIKKHIKPLRLAQKHWRLATIELNKAVGPRENLAYQNYWLNKLLLETDEPNKDTWRKGYEMRIAVLQPKVAELIMSIRQHEEKAEKFWQEALRFEPRLDKKFCLQEVDSIDDAKCRLSGNSSSSSDDYLSTSGLMSMRRTEVGGHKIHGGSSGMGCDQVTIDGANYDVGEWQNPYSGDTIVHGQPYSGDGDKIIRSDGTVEDWPTTWD